MAVRLHPKTVEKIQSGDLTDIDQHTIDAYNETYGAKIVLDTPIDMVELENTFDMQLTPEQESFSPADDVIKEDVIIIGGLYRNEETYLKLFNSGLLEQGSDPVLDRVLRKHGLYKLDAKLVKKQQPKDDSEQSPPFDVDDNSNEDISEPYINDRKNSESVVDAIDAFNSSKGSFTDALNAFNEVMNSDESDASEILSQVNNAVIPEDTPKQPIDNMDDAEEIIDKQDEVEKPKRRRRRTSMAKNTIDTTGTVKENGVVDIISSPQIISEPAIEIANTIPEPIIEIKPAKIIQEVNITNIKNEVKTQPITNEQPDIPKRGDQGWTQYVMSLLNPGEYIDIQDRGRTDRRPRHAGLRRLVELLIGPIVETRNTIQCTPCKDNKYLTAVESTITVSVQNDSHPAYEQEINQEKYSTITWSDIADSFHNNDETSQALLLHPVASTTTAAQTRCFRNLLGLVGIYSSEECGGSKPTEEQRAFNPDSPLVMPNEKGNVQPSQIRFIKSQCMTYSVDPIIVTSDILNKDIESLDELTFGEARTVMSVVNEFAHKGLPEKYQS